MQVEPLALAEVKLVRFPRHADARGHFERTFDRETFAAAGLADCSLQCSLSWNPHAGTLRGLHYQRPPHAESKLVRCLSGRIFDVAVDIRPDSPTFGRWVAVELSPDNGLAIYIPQGFAHGFLTLDEGSLVQYQMAEPFVPGAGSGLRWDDAAIGIEWPLAPALIGDRDLAWGGLDSLASDAGRPR
ncbi:MAG: dTDP-4-dehydrorhamnose 3,5-epimerase [Pseudomonadota bacterium]